MSKLGRAGIEIACLGVIFCRVIGPTKLIQHATIFGRRSYCCHAGSDCRCRIDGANRHTRNRLRSLGIEWTRSKPIALRNRNGGRALGRLHSVELLLEPGRQNAVLRLGLTLVDCRLQDAKRLWPIAVFQAVDADIELRFADLFVAGARLLAGQRSRADRFAVHLSEIKGDERPRPFRAF